MAHNRQLQCAGYILNISLKQKIDSRNTVQTQIKKKKIVCRSAWNRASLKRKLHVTQVDPQAPV